MEFQWVFRDFFKVSNSPPMVKYVRNKSLFDGPSLYQFAATTEAESEVGVPLNLFKPLRKLTAMGSC